MPDPSLIRLGVIGCGGIALQAHLPALRDLAGVEVVAVCDLLPERRQQAVQLFPRARQYSLYLEMLGREQLDGIFVLTEPDQLFRITLSGLRARLHVFMEKPPGITLFKAETLQREARASERILQVGFNRRYIPLVQRVLDLMRELTTITHIEGRFNKHGSAAFYDGCASAFECDAIHVVDLVSWIAGAPLCHASLMESQSNDVVPNRWQALARFENGVTGLIRANYQTGGRTHTLELHGPEASAFINLGTGDAACDAKLLLNRGASLQSLGASGQIEQQQLLLDGMALAPSAAFHAYYGFLQEDQDFVNCIRAQGRPLANIDEGVATMRFVEQLRASTRHSAVTG